MSTITADRTSLVAAKQTSERRHRFLLLLSASLAILFTLLMAVYGFNYYTLNLEQRALSPKDALLKPSGIIGIRLGILGVAMFSLIFLYAFRKRWSWLAKMGSTKHWLDFHIVLGLTAPVVITFHSSFKFGGIAGVAYWIMIAVALSGIVGRYLYAQIPRSIGDAELSLKELQELAKSLAQQLESQRIIGVREIAPLFRPLDPAKVQAMSTATILWVMMERDISRVVGVWRLRCKALGALGAVVTLGGILRSRNRELERVIGFVKKQASLTTRILFLSKTRDLFKLWHVVHRPFSYSFAVLVCIHIAVALLFGYH